MEVRMNNYNTSFGAKLAINDKAQLLKPYEKRLGNIAKIFEEKTSKYTKDVFEISTNEHDPEKATTLTAYVGNAEEGGELTPKGLAELFKLKDNSIVEKFKKIFFTAQKTDKIDSQTDRFLTTVNNSIKKDKISYPEDKVYDYTASIKNQIRRDALKNDKLLSNKENFRFYCI